MILKTAVPVGGNIELMDTIFHEGKYWLIPDWQLSVDDKYIRPLRIICLSTIEHRDVGAPNYRFAIARQLPKGVLLGHPPLGQEKLFEIRENPEIMLPNPDKPDVLN